MRRLSALSLSVLLVAAACTSSGPPAGGDPGATATAVKGGTVVYGIAFELTGLQPLHSADASEVVWSHFYPRLMLTDPDNGDIAPGLATRYEFDAAAKKLVYHIRPGVKWSDGVAFTGADYEYSVEATARSKAAFRKNPFRNVVGFVEYLEGKADRISGLNVSADGMTVTIDLVNGTCPAPRLLASAGGGVLPKHHFSKHWDSRTTDTSKSIEGSPYNDAPPASVGPFVFKEWQRGVQVVMERNESYWKGAPNIEQYIVKNYASDAAVKAALLAGEVTFASISPSDAEEFEKSGRELKVHRAPAASGYYYIGWNMKSPKAPWLANKDVRQALWYGLNVEAVVDKVMLGYATQIYTHLPPSSWAYPQDGLNKYEYDKAKAKQLLEKAGATMGPDGIYRWTDGQPMKMRIESAGAGESAGGAGSPADILAIAQAQYKEIGIEIEPVLQSIQATFERNDPTFVDREGTLGSWFVSTEPDLIRIFFHTSMQNKNNFNWFRYENPEVDRLLAAGATGDCSNAARAQSYQKIGQILNEDAPFTFLYLPDKLTVSQNALQNYELKTFGISTSGQTDEWNAEQWWLKR